MLLHTAHQRDGDAAPPPPEPRGADLRAIADALLLAVLVASVALIAAGPSTARVVVLFAAAAFAPGAALLTLAPPLDALTGPSLAVAVSIAIESLLAAAMALTHFWHPEALGWTLWAGSCALLARDLARRAAARRAPSGAGA